MVFDIGLLPPGLLPSGPRHPLRRFWRSARGFWHGPTARLAWSLMALLVVITVLQLLVQFSCSMAGGGGARDARAALLWRDVYGKGNSSVQKPNRNMPNQSSSYI